MQTYSLTTEEMIVVLSELEETVAAKSLIESLEDLGTEENLVTTLKVATRSLISKGIMEVLDDDYAFDPIFKEVIETYLGAKKTLRVSKVYSNAEFVILIYQSEMGLYVSHSMQEFVFNFSVYENYEQLLTDVVEFSNINEGEQIIDAPHAIKNDITTLLLEAAPEQHEQVLLENDVPEQLVATILDDHTNVELAHAYVIINEDLELVKPALMIQSKLRSWISYEVEEHVEIESYTEKKLKDYLIENFFIEEQ